MSRISSLIPYMGTKRDLAPHVADVLCMASPGIVLDAFSGMCAIGQSVGTRRTIWNNDAQIFPANVAGALFTSKSSPPSAAKLAETVAPHYIANRDELTMRFLTRLTSESAALEANELSVVTDYYSEAAHVGNCQALNHIREQLAKQPNLFPYCLFTITFSDGYFGFAQSVEIDSIRYAIAQCEKDGVLTTDDARWALVALCHAVSKVGTTTGHFAQYLTVNKNNIRAYLAQRKRSVWSVWLSCIQELCPIGTSGWRKKNRVFNMDSLSLLHRLSMSDSKPSVVYADPPYTGDQYSRYYHVWETLVKYDYPQATGKGRYRGDRFSSPFSAKTHVKWAFVELISRTKALDADLVISYPSAGLLQETGSDLLTLLRGHYSKVDLAYERGHLHSTMGASKGMAKNNVVEQVYWARE